MQPWGRWSRIDLMLWSLATMVLGLHGDIAWPAPPKIDAVVTAWEQRESQIQSAHFEWTEKVTYEAGSLVGVDQREVDDDGNPFPQSAVTTTYAHVLDVDPINFRWERTGETWSDLLEAFVSLRQIHVYTRDESWLLLDYLANTDLNRAHDTLYIAKMSLRATGALVPEVAPLMMWARPFSSRRGHFDPVEWLPESIVPLGSDPENPYAEFRFTNRARTDRERRGYLVMDGTFPVTDIRLGRRVRVDVSYVSDPTWGSVPDNWRVALMAPTKDEVEKSRSAKMLKWSINQPTEPSLFDVAIPVGAEVLDRRNLAHPRFYIEGADGQKRDITPDERNRGASFKEMLRTPSGQAGK